MNLSATSSSSRESLPFQRPAVSSISALRNRELGRNPKHIFKVIDQRVVNNISNDSFRTFTLPGLPDTVRGTWVMTTKDHLLAETNGNRIALYDLNKQTRLWVHSVQNPASLNYLLIDKDLSVHLVGINNERQSVTTFKTHGITARWFPQQSEWPFHLIHGSLFRTRKITASQDNKKIYLEKFNKYGNPISIEIDSNNTEFDNLIEKSNDKYYAICQLKGNAGQLFVHDAELNFSYKVDFPIPVEEIVDIKLYNDRLFISAQTLEGSKIIDFDLRTALADIHPLHIGDLLINELSADDHQLSLLLNFNMKKYLYTFNLDKKELNGWEINGRANKIKQIPNTPFIIISYLEEDSIYSFNIFDTEKNGYVHGPDRGLPLTANFCCFDSGRVIYNNDRSIFNLDEDQTVDYNREFYIQDYTKVTHPDKN